MKSKKKEKGGEILREEELSERKIRKKNRINMIHHIYLSIKNKILEEKSYHTRNNLSF